MKVIDIKTGEDITPLPLTKQEEFTQDLIDLSQQSVPLLEIIDILFKKYNLC